MKNFIIATIVFVVLMIVNNSWVLEAHNCVAENGRVSIPYSPPTTPSQESKERIRSGRKQLFPVLGLASINLDIIAKIESNNNPLAYNPKSKARGLYQITPICLKDYNDWHPTSKIASNALYNPIEARKVAEWYLTIRIPQMLKLGGFAPKIDYMLICYNFGYGNFKKWLRQGGDYSKLPRETQKYLIKYYELVKLK